MNRIHTTTAVVILISFCLVGAGCTTTRTLPVPRTAAESGTNRIEIGSKVVVTLRSGETRAFRVTAVEPDALLGKGLRISIADIEKIQQKEISGRRTAAALVGGTLAVLAGVYAIWLHNLTHCPRHEC
jgi:hypothetical protein